MTTEAWVQILVAVSIVAVVFLIVTLYRLYGVLGDVKEVSAIAAERAKEVDAKIDQAEKKIDSLSEVLKGFVYSLDIIKVIREKFKKSQKEDKK